MNSAHHSGQEVADMSKSEGKVSSEEKRGEERGTKDVHDSTRSSGARDGSKRFSSVSHSLFI